MNNNIFSSSVVWQVVDVVEEVAAVEVVVGDVVNNSEIYLTY
jgi:hypothetical protein